MWRNQNFYTLLVGMQNMQLLWKTVWSFLNQLNIELPYNSASNSTHRLMPKRTERRSLRPDVVAHTYNPGTLEG